MNVIDEFLAHIPISEVTIRTTLSKTAVLERIEYGPNPSTILRLQKSQFYTFISSSEMNLFMLQGHLRNPDGDDAFPDTWNFIFCGIRIPVKVEASPTFYGRVSEDRDGAIIRGHFGMPTPTWFLIGALSLMGLAKMNPAWEELSLFFSLILIIGSIFGMFGFVIERKGILDFLTGLFSDVVRKK